MLGDGGIFGLIGSAVQAAGAVGSSVITADAQKYAAKQAATAQIQQALAEQRALLAQEEAAAQQAQIAGENQVTEIKVLVLGLVALVVVGAVVVRVTRKPAAGVV